MTEILSAVSPSVFSWRMLGRRSSAAFVLSRPEKGVWWPTPCRTRPAWVAVIALVLASSVDISSQCRTAGPRESTCHLLLSLDVYNKLAQEHVILLKSSNSFCDFYLLQNSFVGSDQLCSTSGPRVGHGSQRFCVPNLGYRYSKSIPHACWQPVVIFTILNFAFMRQVVFSATLLRRLPLQWGLERFQYISLSWI